MQDKTEITQKQQSLIDDLNQVFKIPLFPSGGTPVGDYGGLAKDDSVTFSNPDTHYTMMSTSVPNTFTANSVQPVSYGGVGMPATSPLPDAPTVTFSTPLTSLGDLLVNEVPPEPNNWNGYANSKKKKKTKGKNKIKLPYQKFHSAKHQQNAKFVKEQLKAKNLHKDLFVMVSDSNHLQIDMDDVSDEEMFFNRLKLLKHNVKIKGYRETESKSGNKHFIIELKEPLPPVERILLQMYLLSDPAREILSYFGAKAGNEDAILLIEKRSEWPGIETELDPYKEADILSDTVEKDWVVKEEYNPPKDPLEKTIEIEGFNNELNNKIYQLNEKYKYLEKIHNPEGVLKINPGWVCYKCLPSGYPVLVSLKEDGATIIETSKLAKMQIDFWNNQTNQSIQVTKKENTGEPLTVEDLKESFKSLEKQTASVGQVVINEKLMEQLKETVYDCVTKHVNDNDSKKPEEDETLTGQNAKKEFENIKNASIDYLNNLKSVEPLQSVKTKPTAPIPPVKPTAPIPPVKPTAQVHTEKYIFKKMADGKFDVSSKIKIMKEDKEDVPEMPKLKSTDDTVFIPKKAKSKTETKKITISTKKK